MKHPAIQRRQIARLALVWLACGGLAYGGSRWRPELADRYRYTALEQCADAVGASYACTGDSKLGMAWWIPVPARPGFVPRPRDPSQTLWRDRTLTGWRVAALALDLLLVLLVLIPPVATWRVLAGRTPQAPPSQ